MPSGPQPRPDPPIEMTARSAELCGSPELLEPKCQPVPINAPLIPPRQLDHLLDDPPSRRSRFSANRSYVAATLPIISFAEVQDISSASARTSSAISRHQETCSIVSAGFGLANGMLEPLTRIEGDEVISCGLKRFLNALASPSLLKSTQTAKILPYWSQVNFDGSYRCSLSHSRIPAIFSESSPVGTLINTVVMIFSIQQIIGNWRRRVAKRAVKRHSPDSRRVRG